MNDTDTYSAQHPWWTKADHDALRVVTDRLQPRTVLEFGPGMSTLSFVEAGARWIDTFEDEERWYDLNARLFHPHRQIQHHLYRRHDPLVLPLVGTMRYDLAFVDGPRHPHERAPEMRYAREHAAAVVVHDFWYPAVRKLVAGLFATGGWKAEQFTTKPDEALALLTRPRG